MTTAIAHANIALVKYWGKADPRINAPAVGSLSLTLSNLWTRTTVDFRKSLKTDRFYLNNKQVAPHERDRLTNFMDEVRRRSAIDCFCEIHSINSFPTAAGLASSASGYAALATAAMHHGRSTAVLRSCLPAAGGRLRAPFKLRTSIFGPWRCWWPSPTAVPKPSARATPWR